MKPYQQSVGDLVAIGVFPHHVLEVRTGNNTKFNLRLERGN